MGRIVKTVQTNFTAGELDPLLKARIDVKHYYSGAETLRNLMVIPQGGVTRRPGLEYLATLANTLTRRTGQTITCPNGGTTANANDNDTATEVVTTTNLGVINPYVVVHYDLGSQIEIMHADAVGMKLSAGSLADEFRIQWSTDDAAWNDLGDTFDLTTTDLTVRRSSPNYVSHTGVTARYWRLVRVGATDMTTTKVTVDEFNLWTSVLTGGDQFKLIPFEFSVAQAYMLVASDRNIAVWKNGAHLINVRSDFTGAQLAATDYTQSLDTLILMHEDIYPKRLLRDSTAEGVWNFSNAPLTNIPTYDFGAGAESVWSATRGYPKHASFYDSRLVFGGSKSRPQTVWASKTGEFYNFDVGTGLDDEAIDVTLDTDQVNAITAVYSGRQLQIFTTGGEFAAVQTINEPITPGNITIRRQTSRGSKTGLRPVEVEGATLFIQRQGKAVREFVYDELEAAYTASNISLLSSHLISDPIDFAIRKSTSTSEADYLLVVNDDGTLAVCATLRSQDITAWSLMNTSDSSGNASSFKNVGVLVEGDKSMYFVVNRGAAGYQLERFNNDHYLDNSLRYTSGLPTDTFAMDHIASGSINVYADQSVLNSVTATGGDVTISRDAATSVELGVNFTPSGKDMPIEPNLPDGTVVGRKKRVIEVVLRLSQTQALTVRGQKLSFRGFGEAGAGSPLDAAPPIFTGDKRIEGLLGHDDYGQITFQQDDPGPLTILALAKKVAV